MSEYTSEEHAEWREWVRKYGTQEMAGCEVLRALKAADSIIRPMAIALNQGMKIEPGSYLHDEAKRFIEPPRSEDAARMTHDELVKIAVRWLKKPREVPCSPRTEGWYKPGCGVAVPELVTYNGEIPDAIGWVGNGYSYAIECKTSLTDFRADFKKNRHRIPDSLYVGAQCLYLCPEDVISPADVPAPWGLLYANERGKVRVVNTPRHNTRRNIAGEMALMYSLLRRVEIHGNLRACLSPKWGGVNPLTQ